MKMMAADAVVVVAAVDQASFCIFTKNLLIAGRSSTFLGSYQQSHQSMNFSDIL